MEFVRYTGVLAVYFKSGQIMPLNTGCKNFTLLTEL